MVHGRMLSIDSTLTVPKSGERRGSFNSPLSSHGMPKPPSGPTLRPHRFSDKGAPSPVSSSISSPPVTPGPFSPPMSAKSFSTFIDSEPSTPAHSPRQGSYWDNSALVLLSPPDASTPSSPAVPKVDLVLPLQQPKALLKKPKVMPRSASAEISSSTSLTSHPTGPTSKDDPEKENMSPEDREPRKESEESPHDTLGMLMARMKSMLRKKEKKRQKREEKKRQRFENLQRLDTMHWTEM